MKIFSINCTKIDTYTISRLYIFVWKRDCVRCIIFILFSELTRQKTGKAWMIKWKVLIFLTSVVKALFAFFPFFTKKAFLDTLLRKRLLLLKDDSIYIWTECNADVWWGLYCLNYGFCLEKQFYLVILNMTSCTVSIWSKLLITAPSPIH